MEKIELEGLKPNKGFKVMEWLRAIREEQHRLYENNPKEYYRQLEIAEKEFFSDETGRASLKLLPSQP
jgi:hypothetical protein